MCIGSNNNRSTAANKYNTFIERDLLAYKNSVALQGGPVRLNDLAVGPQKQKS